jgi:hypothetical protein
MVAAQMALPIERRNGASAPHTSPAPVEVVAQVLEAEAAAVPVWVRRVTTAAVLAVAGVAAVASYESPYVKWCW